MRALYPHTDGVATNPTDGIRVFYEVFGPPNAARTLIFLPSWTIVHSRIWKAQVPFFSRRGFRVVTFDNRGNGQSDRPASGYSVARIAEDALAVMNAVGTERAALIGLSAGARWGVKLAAEHPERITYLALIAPSVTLGPPSERLRRFREVRACYAKWDKYSEPYWRQDYPGFLEFFAHQVHCEPHCTKHIEDFLAWGLGTTGEILIKTIEEGAFPRGRPTVLRRSLPDPHRAWHSGYRQPGRQRTGAARGDPWLRVGDDRRLWPHTPGPRSRADQPAGSK